MDLLHLQPSLFLLNSLYHYPTSGCHVLFWRFKLCQIHPVWAVCVCLGWLLRRAVRLLNNVGQVFVLCAHLLCPCGHSLLVDTALWGMVDMVVSP